MTRTLPLTRSAEPSTTASTLSSFAISARGLSVPLYLIEEEREITFNAPIFARSVIRASVIPSAKYSCSGSPERFRRGSTAMDSMGAGPARLDIWSHSRMIFGPRMIARTATRSPAAAHKNLRRARHAEGVSGTAFSSLARSPVDSYRSPGSFDRQRSTTAASSPGISSFTFRMGSGSS